MPLRFINTWYKRFALFVILSPFAGGWLPAGLFATHEARSNGLTFATNCRMEPIHYPDGGVSGTTVCFGSQIDVGVVAGFSLISIAVTCALLAPVCALAWIITGPWTTRQVPAETSARPDSEHPATPEPKEFPIYHHGLAGTPTR